ncbi:fumarylacetoacetate hydrolase family protein [uncultured Sphingomonas sp.]|uniref:fumarylacetoacetate hydrolase family protein n=1 Tax=uncultured Sphingomonas sp. TaxID=158754 RepID=UPI0035CA500D
MAGSGETFAVRRIYCVGRNYAAHAVEMGHADRAPPFFFTKFADTLVPSGTTLAYPPETADYHYEGELVIAIGADTFQVTPEQAPDHVFGYACGLDMTRRDIQLGFRDRSEPWDLGKNFSQGAVLGAIHPASEIGHPVAGSLVLKVNGVVRQDADLADLMWPCADIVAYLSRFDRLAAGDLIYTGTPAGVGPVVPGDIITLTIDRLTPVSATVGQPHQAVQASLPHQE